MARVTVSVDDTLMAQIQQLAEAEMRSKANMMRILIVEALEARAKVHPPQTSIQGGKVR